jgi:2-haloacid dehalogenase
MISTLISFDCYGTLIDWESGILDYFRGLANAYAIAITDDAILAAYSEFEPAIQSGSYRSYREVLREVVVRFCERFGLQPSKMELESLSESLPSWQPFGDTVEALRVLKQQYKLAIVSNIDNDLFAATAGLLGVSFDWIITAEALRSYKPAPAHFNELLRRTGLPKCHHLHAAESLFHDIAPTNALGIPNVWVNRSEGKRVSTASRRDLVQPDRIVNSLAELVSMLT